MRMSEERTLSQLHLFCTVHNWKSHGENDGYSDQFYGLNLNDRCQMTSLMLMLILILRMVKETLQMAEYVRNSGPSPY